MKTACKITAFLLLFATLITSTHLNILIPFESSGVDVTDYINASKTCDYGEDGSYFELDDSGRLWLFENESYCLIGELDADLIALDSNILYFSSGKRVYAYNVFNGDTDLVFTAKSDVISFCAADDVFYYLCADGIFQNQNGKSKLIKVDTPSSEYFECELPELPAKIMLESKTKLVLYFQNPDYVDESTCEIGVEIEDNTEYIPFVYDIKTHDTTDDISLLITEKEFAESLANSSQSYMINGIALPLEQYPVNSFFSKNGKSCTCHNKGICVAAHSYQGCNCMRYYPSESNKEIDLLSSQ